jgi:predicted sulfurtransferase
MSTAPTSGQELRISAQEFKRRVESGEPITVIDARNRSDWESSQIKIRNAIRFHASYFQNSPPWPHDQLTVVY